MANSYIALLGPSVGVLVAGLVFYALFKVVPSNSHSPNQASSLELPEVVALMGFAIMPFFAIAVSKLGGSTFFFRYCISMVAGIGCLFGIAAAKRAPVGLGVLFCLVVQIALNQHYYKKEDSTVEPLVRSCLARAPNYFPVYIKV